jgi:hypothetical protein
MLKTRAADFLETLLIIYQTAWCHILGQLMFKKFVFEIDDAYWMHAEAINICESECTDPGLVAVVDVYSDFDEI